MTKVRLEEAKKLLGENLGGFAFAAVLFLMCFLAIVVPANIRSTPVTSVTEVESTILNAFPIPINPISYVSQGPQYRYSIRLHNSGAVVFADGSMDFPLIGGTQVKLHREHHENGIDTYRLPGN